MHTVDVGRWEGYIRAERGADNLIGVQRMTNFGDPRCDRDVYDWRTRQRVIEPQVQTFVVNDREYRALHYSRQR